MRFFVFFVVLLSSISEASWRVGDDDDLSFKTVYYPPHNGLYSCSRSELVLSYDSMSRTFYAGGSSVMIEKCGAQTLNFSNGASVTLLASFTRYAQISPVCFKYPNGFID